MTDRYHTLTVVLERDIREDDAESLMAAIGHLKGVIKVAGVVSDYNSHMAEERAKAGLRDKLWDLAK